VRCSAGVFAALGPAAAAAGSLLLVALALAAVVATCNALSSAQLAALHPESPTPAPCVSGRASDASRRP